MSHLKITEILSVHCNIVKNYYQRILRVLYVFVPNKSFGQLLNISPKCFTFLKPFSSEFSYIEVRLAEQNSKFLEITKLLNYFSY